MPGASAPTLSQVKIDTFLGADLTNSPANADENRSPDCENMIRDVPGKVRKRMGWQVKRTLDGRINGYHALMGHAPLVHAGTKLYKGDSVVYSDANDARSRSWEFGEKLSGRRHPERHGSGAATAGRDDTPRRGLCSAV